MAEGMVRERLNIYYLLDTSASMSGERIQQFNTCMQDIKPALEEAGIKNNVEIAIRVIEFGNNNKAAWSLGTSKYQFLNIDNFTWMNLHANGLSTPTSLAINEVERAIDPEALGTRTLRPVILLVTDGGCTDGSLAYTDACNKLKSKINGNTIRIAIGVKDANKAELEEFATNGVIGDEQNKPFVFEVNNADTMIQVIRWASVVSIKSSSKAGVADHSGTGTTNSDNVSIPDPTWI